MWCCLFFNFTQFVILENLSILDLALSAVKGLTDKMFYTVVTSISPHKVIIRRMCRLALSILKKP